MRLFDSIRTCSFVNGEIVPEDQTKISIYDLALMFGLPITSLNGLPIGDGKPGSSYNALLNQWSKNVWIDIKTQIKAWNIIDASASSDAPTPYRFKTEIN